VPRASIIFTLLLINPLIYQFNLDTNTDRREEVGVVPGEA